MINFEILKSKVNNLLDKYYPIKTNLDNIYNLSHFYINFVDWNKYLPFSFNIYGTILNGKYINYKIINVITIKKYSYKEFIYLYVSLLNRRYNPYINKNNFLILLHLYNNIDILNIKNLIIKNNDKIIDIPIIYIKNTSHLIYNIKWQNNIPNNIINKSNHFYLDSFDIYNNKNQLKRELSRLFINRDKYKSIHFHLNNNGGGDIVPAHLILRCLLGYDRKEKWMKNIKKILINKELLEWNCWKEEDINSPNYNVIKYLDIDLYIIEKYKTKYNGKIYVHMYSHNGSSAWFFITYLIYAFGKNIKRFSKKYYGKILKFGKIDAKCNLIIKGISGTTSGDGNVVGIKYKNIDINIPTEQFIDCSIKKYDWNRYWIEN